MGSSMNYEIGVNAMFSSIGSWLSILALVVGPFWIGVFFEEKVQRANRELGSKLLLRY
jgi:hypothetical protein